ncbi:antibiotic biosynthesis monooxygenase [Xanthomonas sp. AmX2]|uniref:putative quinol monooxygenase n=1 Tax=Xanthomonas sp. TaxID=29446 RepID=UPI00197CD1D6|nr:putative quinol monooxygenase [Xanthomonas sp.]MBN6151838.1 antibiotic biosynthesis monooxygenase [Xanthomonas sp.]
MTAISKIAFFAARRGEEAKLGQQLLALVGPSRAEPGSLRYEILQDGHDDGLWTVLEDWRSEADFDLHMATEYVQAFMRQVPSLCDGQPDIRTYHKRSSSDRRPFPGDEHAH